MDQEQKNEVLEKRVTGTVIRRRSRPAPEKKEETVASPAAVAETAPAKQASQSPDKIEKSAPQFSAVKPPVPALGELGKGIAEPEEEKKELSKKPRKRSKAELDMEMILRAGGLKKVALMQDPEEEEPTPEAVVPEAIPLDRIFQPTHSARRKKVLSKKDFKKTAITTPKASKRVLKIENSISVAELAKRMGVKVGDVVKKLMNLGVTATLNQSIDFDTTSLVAQEFHHEVENVAFKEQEVLTTAPDELEDLAPRPPVVTVMGHVDHGKTSILDVIRQANVAAGEAGGITQHIGAYNVHFKKGSITFIDTPGHEAFTAMRARGAQVTDIVVLVVAANDGVMPQTVEAINHAKAAEVPIVVAINKVDLPDANIEKVRQGLSNYALLSEEWGGETIMVPVSAKTKAGIDKLLEMILLQAEVQELKANPKKRAEGMVVEAKLDKGRGPVATVIVQNGTLRQGDLLVVGAHTGRARALVTATGASVKEAGPSMPVEILGLSGVPEAGDLLHGVESEEQAQKLAEHRQRRQKVQSTAPGEAPAMGPVSLEELFAGTKQEDERELNVVLKGDVQGSVEAVKALLLRIGNEKAKVNVIHSAVGAVTESDVMLAEASKAIVVAFNVRPDTKARKVAESQKVDIRNYTIIYELEDEVKKALTGLLKPTIKETYVGRADVRQVFTVSKIGKVAGCMVVDGKIVRNAGVRLLRDGAIVYEGKLSSLKRFKDDAREVSAGAECGMGIEGYADIKEGDVIEAFRVQEIEAKL